MKGPWLLSSSVVAYAELVTGLLDPYARLGPDAVEKVPAQVVLRRRSILDAYFEAAHKQRTHWKLQLGQL